MILSRLPWKIWTMYYKLQKRIGLYSVQSMGSCIPTVFRLVNSTSVTPAGWPMWPPLSPVPVLRSTQYGTKYGVVSSHNYKFGGDFDFHSRTTTTLPPLLSLLLLRPHYYFMLPPEREKGKFFFFFLSKLITFAQSYLCLLYTLLALFRKDKSSFSPSPQFHLNSSVLLPVYHVTISTAPSSLLLLFLNCFQLSIFEYEGNSALLIPTAE